MIVAFHACSQFFLRIITPHGKQASKKLLTNTKTKCKELDLPPLQREVLVVPVILAHLFVKICIDAGYASREFNLIHCPLKVEGLAVEGDLRGELCCCLARSKARMKLRGRLTR